ncbi:type I restriction enzyme S subunit [Catenulispora sp. EB89]|uniref:restriction endonuclease subunit S n=1 Tax=Catenulispora sp. EB89 TaxID=3156257 RepID=UPI0035129466
MTEWRSTTIGDVMTLQRGVDITKASQRPGPVPVISSGGIGSYHDTPYVDGPGVVMGRKGTLGRVYYVDRPYWPHDTTLWVKDFKGNHPRFIYYFLQTLDFLGMDVGSSNPTLNRNHVHPISVRWPDLGGQVGIAAVLAALDDKIAVNERIADTAYELLQARWQLRAGATRERVKFSQIADLDKGLSYKGAYLGSGVSMVNLANLGVTGRFNRSELKYYSGEVRERHWVRDGDLVLANTDLTQRREILGRPALVRTGDKRALFSHHVFAVRMGSDFLVETPWVYGALRSHEFHDRAVTYATGTTVAALPKDAVLDFEIPWPEHSVRREWSRRACTLMECAESHMDEVASLAALRDTLLPKLMSGELRVRDAEQIVGEAT